MTLVMFFISMVVITLGYAKAPTTDETRPISDEAPPLSKTITPEEAFDKMMKVLMHKRCVNCHPAGDQPRQGEDSHLHYFGVQRGPDNHGLAALKCQSCHQSENNNRSGVPGAPEWSVAPKSMYWEGLSRVEIARSMMDPTKNGGRNLDELVHHLTEHELVLWAWEPGIDASGESREKPPVPVDEYVEAVKTWAEAGAPIPAK